MRKEKDIIVEHGKENEYYTVQDLKLALSYNCDYTVLSSIRNLGKTYSAMQLCIEKMKSGQTVLWERYNRDELKLACKTWENMIHFNKPVSAGGYLEYTSDEFDGKLLICQTSVVNIKGYDDIYDKLPVLEVKDEFLPVRYLQSKRFLNEYSDAMEIRKTFKRNGPMRSIYLSNCLNWMNPYTIAWEMMPIDTGKARIVTDEYKINVDDTCFTDKRSIYWESVKPTKAMINRILRTEISSMNVTSLDEYIDNEFYKEYSKIEKCPDMNVQLENVQLMSDGYYFSYRIYNGRLYFCKVRPKKDVRTYVDEKKYVDIDTMHFRFPSLASEYESYFNEGKCIFDSSKTYMMYQRWLINNRKRI